MNIDWKLLEEYGWELTVYSQYEYRLKKHTLTLLEPGFDGMAELMVTKVTERSIGSKTIKFQLPCVRKVYEKAIAFAEHDLGESLESIKHPGSQPGI